MTERKRLSCATCGSLDIRKDAWATWNEVTQTWELDNWFDYTWCCDCEGETTVAIEYLKD